MSDNNSQSTIAIGVGLIVVSIILFSFAFTSPRKTVSTLITSTEALVSTTEQSTTANQIETVSGYSDYQEEIAITFPLNLNTCTQEDLLEIDKIGEARASAIIQYREYLGGYTSVEQIKDIKGIGEALYEEIAPYLTI